MRYLRTLYFVIIVGFTGVGHIDNCDVYEHPHESEEEEGVKVELTVLGLGFRVSLCRV